MVWDHRKKTVVNSKSGEKLDFFENRHKSLHINDLGQPGQSNRRNSLYTNDLRRKTKNVFP